MCDIYCEQCSKFKQLKFSEKIAIKDEKCSKYEIVQLQAKTITKLTQIYTDINIMRISSKYGIIKLSSWQETEETLRTEKVLGTFMIKISP